MKTRIYNRDLLKFLLSQLNLNEGEFMIKTI